MPNTLGHFGIQGVATRLVIRDADPKWIFTGCILPDVPWILKRGLQIVAPGADPFGTRLYAIVQSSLAGSLVLAGALALFSRRPRLTFLVLGLSCVLHILLDAAQIKWGSGFYLGAPGTWRSLDYGLFWPESAPTYLLTLFGVVYFAWAWWRRPGVSVQPQWPRSRNLALTLLLLAAYFALPLAFLGSAERANTHFVRTLRQPRAGEAIELDRARYVRGESGDVIRTWAQTEHAVAGKRHERSATVSIRGVVRNPETIEIVEIHDHGEFSRDLMSYAGLTLLALMWIRALRRRL